MARTAAQPAGISRIARGALKKSLVFEDKYSMYNSRYYSGVLLKEGFRVFFVCFPRLLNILSLRIYQMFTSSKSRIRAFSLRHTCTHVGPVF